MVGTFGNSIHDWVNIDADLLLFVFLPPLIFGEAMSLNWYHLKGGFLQSVVLAGPGVLIGAALMGAIAKIVLPYNWGWNLAMVFGSILSATDPVAVVALLKSVGASPKLTILIVGESLLNDGSAMVLFTLFFNSLNGTVYTASSIFSFFIFAAFGSVLIGVVFGLVTVRWLRSANRPLKEIDVTTQIAITICCAYLCFFTAQYALKISGVLACCGAGAMLAWLAPPIILNQESMHNVWGMIEWSLNTMIFLLAGLIIGNRVISKVYAVDWAYLLLLYFILMIIRFITIAILFPIISRIGHRCTMQEAVFMSWAGLRGALCMALALIVEKYCPEDISGETSRLFFFVGGIAAMTLVINATTAKAVLYKLGLLSTNSAEKELVTNQIKKKLRRKLDKIVDQMAKDFAFTSEDLDTVRQACTLLHGVDMDALYRDTERMSSLLADATLQQPSPLSGSQQSSISGLRKHLRNESFGNNAVRRQSHSAQRYTDQARINHISRLLSRSHVCSNVHDTSLVFSRDLLHYIRAIFLEIVRVKYWHYIELGKLPRLSHSAQFLLYTIEVGLDEVNQFNGARDWNCLVNELNYKANAVWLLTMWERNLPVCMTRFATSLLGHLEYRREKRAVYMLTSFIEAHEHAQKKIHTFLGLDENEGEEVIQTPEEISVIEESAHAVRAAKEYLSKMSPSTVNQIKSRQAARLVLAKQAEMVRNMVQEGVLTANHAEEFLEEISHDTVRIEKERNRMYKEHAMQKVQQKHEEVERRSSLFSFADMMRSSHNTTTINVVTNELNTPLVQSVADNDDVEATGADNRDF